LTSTEPNTLEIRHEPEAGRFVARVSGTEAVLAYRTLDTTTLDYYHTFVPPALRGHGIASDLTDYALRHALERHLKVVPSCPFVARYIERHPELRSVLA
jgi:predicted GNAT family acetyltransferase